MVAPTPNGILVPKWKYAISTDEAEYMDHYHGERNQPFAKLSLLPNAAIRQRNIPLLRL